LSIIDTLKVSPAGNEVAYVEGGMPHGPVVIRALADGAKTVVARHEEGREMLVLGWSPDGRKLLWASRNPHELPSSCFVFDRASAQTENIDIGTGELMAWLPSGEIVVTGDDAALVRVDRGTKTSVTTPFILNYLTLDAPRRRLLSSGWNDKTHLNEVLAIDLATFETRSLAPPASYATYASPKASRGGRVAWLEYDRASRTEALVVDGKKIVGAHDLVGFEWIDERALVAHYAGRIEVVSARDGKTKASQATGADDILL
jgi:hypothetical protein